MVAKVGKYGRNPAVTAAEDVWNGGGVYTGHPVTATGALPADETFEIFSSSDDDTAAGSGAQAILLTAMTSEGDYSLVPVELAGTASVFTAFAGVRGPTAYVSRAGSGGVNAGDITIRHSSTTANVFAVMPAGYGETQIAASTVPRNRRAVIRSVKVGVTNSHQSGQDAEVAFGIRLPGTNAWRYQRPLIVSTESSSLDILDGTLVLPPLTDMKVRVMAVTNTLLVTARWNMDLPFSSFRA